MDEPSLDSNRAFPHNVQDTFAQLYELGIKTWEGFRFMEPEEIVRCTSPQELLVKQTRQLLFNECKWIEYVQQCYLLLGNAVMPMIEDTVKLEKDSVQAMGMYPIQTFMDANQSLVNPQNESLNPAQIASQALQTLTAPILGFASKSLDDIRDKRLSKISPQQFRENKRKHR